jgi:hypothetical protein
MTLADSRWKHCVAAIDMQIKRSGSNIIAIMVRANAPSLPSMERGYRCSVSACYPLLPTKQQRLDKNHDEEGSSVLSIEKDASVSPSLNGSGRRSRKSKYADQ